MLPRPWTAVRVSVVAVRAAVRGSSGAFSFGPTAASGRHGGRDDDREPMTTTSVMIVMMMMMMMMMMSIWRLLLLLPTTMMTTTITQLPSYPRPRGSHRPSGHPNKRRRRRAGGGGRPARRPFLRGRRRHPRRHRHHLSLVLLLLVLSLDWKKNCGKKRPSFLSRARPRSPVVASLAKKRERFHYRER